MTISQGLFLLRPPSTSLLYGLHFINSGRTPPSIGGLRDEVLIGDLGTIFVSDLIILEGRYFIFSYSTSSCHF